MGHWRSHFLCSVWCRAVFLSNWIVDCPTVFLNNHSFLADVKSHVYRPLFSKSYRVSLEYSMGLDQSEHTIVCRKHQRSRKREQRDTVLLSRHVKSCGWSFFLSPFPVSPLHIPQGEVSWINYLHQITGMRTSPGETGLGEEPSFLLFLNGDCGSHHLSFKKKKKRDSESPKCSLFWSSDSDSMRKAWVCLHISSINSLWLLVTSLLLASKEAMPQPLTHTEEQGGLISENLRTTTLSTYL